MQSIRSKDSHTQGTDNKLELKLNVKDLETLHSAFSVKRNESEELKLKREEFIEILSLVLCKGNKEEYGDLFDKIDITREGIVDWEKFASHMLLEFYEKDDRIKSSSLPQWKELKTLNGPHKDVIQKIVHMKNVNRYLTISKEGHLGLWGSDLKIQTVIKTSTDSCRPKDLWVTDFVLMSNVNKITVSYTSKEIDFFELTVKMELNCKVRLQNIPRIPLCMDYWHHPDNNGEAILVWGDTEGYISIVNWSAVSSFLFERVASKASDKDENMHTIPIPEIIAGQFKNVTFYVHKAHQDWIRKINYIPNLECFVSCATNWNTSMVICWLEKHNPTSSKSSDMNGSKDDLYEQENRGIAKTSIFTVHQGINSFAYNDGLNLIATAGVNFHVCLWNPYVISKPNGLLRGHMASVTDVQFHKSRNLLLSFSKDKVLRIWDVQLQVCLHRLAGVFPKGQEAALANPKTILYSKMFFHEEKLRLFITFNYGLTMLEMKPDIRDKIYSHQKPLIGCLYNSLYNQIVTACQAGIVYCWMVDTGQRVKTISEICSQGSEMTCITQDSSQTRLYTGATDGLVKIYDFNGHCYNTLICADGNPADIGQIVILKRCILVFGFSKFITAFWTSNFKDHKVYPSKWNGVQTHRDDILSGTSIPPHAVATGAYDGEIIIWNINSEQASRVLKDRSQVEVKEMRNLILQTQRKTNSLDGTSDGPEKMKTLENIPSGTTDKDSSEEYEDDYGGGTTTDTVSEMTDCMFNVSRLIYLDTRKKTKTGYGANLISCGGNGIVRFWNVSDGSLIGEYLAHENASSIIMNTTEDQTYLATADMDGFIKLWDISNYCLHEEANMQLMIPPPLKEHWQCHSDEISGLTFCKRFDRYLLITCSADQSAALWELNGHLIGRLGQEARWKLSQKIENPIINVDEPFISGDEEHIPDLYEPDPNWQPDVRATEDPANYRINTWEKTTLGKDYQELRIKKRERIQPKSIPDLPYLYGEKLGRPTFGPFYSLKITNIEDVEELEKPGFTESHDRFFADSEGYLIKTARVPLLAQNPTLLNQINRSNRNLNNSLPAAFDERSIFNRDLDYKGRHRNPSEKYRRPSESLLEVGVKNKNQVRLQPIEEISKQKTKSVVPQKAKG